MEKLVKSVNYIKLYYAGEEEELENVSTKNERQDCCKTMAETVLSASIKSTSDYPTYLGVTLETLLLCCNDAEADVRIAAQESLNRIINGTGELHFSKVLIEFYKEIKRNGSSRSLRAALSRFSNLAHRIRPSKCRPYIMSLIPVFIRICSREDEGVQECLSNSIAKIFSLIGSFASEAEVKDLIKASMNNLSHISAAIRRNAASCIYEVVNNCNKRMYILSNTISDLLKLFCDSVEESNYALGVITALRYLVPIIGADDPTHNRRTGSFGSEKNSNVGVSFDSLIVNLFQLCCRLLSSDEQSVITAALETLQAILKLPCDLLHRLISSTPLPKTEFSECIAQNLLCGMEKPTISGKCDDEQLEIVSHQHLVQNSSEDDTVTENLSTLHIADDQAKKAIDKNEVRIPDLTSHDKDTAQMNEIVNNNDEVGSPLNSITRLLCKAILQIGTERDKNIRISAKSLAISSIGLILKIRPEIMFLSLSNETNDRVSEVLSFRTFYDPQVRGCVLVMIAQFLESALLVSKGAYNQWASNMAAGPTVDTLVQSVCEGLLDDSTVCVRAAIQSTCICIRALFWTDFAHLGIQLIERLLLLKDTAYWLVKVDMLDALSGVKLRKLLFPRETSHDSTISSNYDLLSNLCDKIMNVAFEALGDKDGRVRKAASAMLVKSVSQNGFVINSMKCDMALSEIAKVSSQFNISEAMLPPAQAAKTYGKSLLTTYRGYESANDTSYIAHNLSKLVGKITELLSFSTSKNLTQGCIQALLMLSSKYSISKHPYSYDCHFCTDTKSGDKKQLTGLLTALLPLVDSMWPSLEIVAYADAITLVGNYIAGLACHSFQIIGANPKLNRSETLLPPKGAHHEVATSLSAFVDPKIGALALRYFMHVMKLLSMLHHIISNSAPSMPNKSVLQTLQTSTAFQSTSNSKKKDKNDSKEMVIGGVSHKKTSSTGKTPSEESEKEKVSKNSHNLIFSFTHSRVHMKLYDTLLGIYETYKTTLETDEMDKFSLFLCTVLDAFNQILEIVTFDDIEKYTEDILLYLKTTFTIEPTMTVQAVQQLLKGLFGTNLVNRLDLDDQMNVKVTSAANHGHEHHKASFYHQTFHRPLNDFTMAIANSSFHHFLQQESAPKSSSGWFGSIKKKVEQKLSMTAKRSKADKMSIQGYIRLFESVVIKSLKYYTMTSSAEFQKHVLNLLAQLVQLRVNYCLLDSDQIFIGFIIKQFESIEGGLVRNSTVLIPHVFFFLVLLSYENHHSKNIITMPKIIQLCDGVMAGGCDTATHVIPALQPIVHDLFVLRAGHRQDVVSDLDTQREVVQSMLFRIIEHSEVLKMVTTILQYYRKESPEHWKRYSRQVTDVLLPMISHLKLRIHSHTDTLFLHSLFEALSPTALRPIDLVLNIFFMLPSDLAYVRSHQQWIVKTNTLLRVLLCQLKEDFLLQRIQEMSVDADAFSTAVLTITKTGDHECAGINGNESACGAEASPIAEDILAKVCLQIAGFTIERIVDSTFDPVKYSNHDKDIKLLATLLSEFILSLTYICRSGNFKKVSKAMKNFLKSSPSQFYTSAILCSLFQQSSVKYPFVSLLWTQFLACVGFMDLTQWGKLTGKSSKVGVNMPLLNTCMVNRGAVIMLADYVCQNQSEVEAMSWVIVNHIKEVLMLQSEPPIQDFIGVLHRNSAASRLFVESIMTLFTLGAKIKTSLKHRLLYCLLGLHLKQSDIIVGLLLSEDWFVFSPVVSISEFSERLSCTRLEMMLVQAAEHKEGTEHAELLTTISEFEQDFKRCEAIPRLGRLAGLAQRLKHLLQTGKDDPKSARRLNVNTSPKYESEADKLWYKGLINSCLTKNFRGHEIANILSALDYGDIVEIFQMDIFDLERLDDCLRFAFWQNAQPDDGIDREMSSPLLSASMTILVAHLKSFVDQTPEIKVNFYDNVDTPTISLHGNSQISEHWRSVFQILSMPQNQLLVTVLAKSFTRSLIWQQVLGKAFKELIGLDRYLLKLAVLFHQYLIWLAINCKTIDVELIVNCSDFLHQVISLEGVQEAFFNPDNVFNATVIINSLYAVQRNFSEKLGVSNYDTSVSVDSIFLKSKVSPLFVVYKACELLDNLNSCPSLPANIRGCLEKSLKLVLCHPFFNKYGRVPPLLLKSDFTIEDIKAIGDEPPASYLSDKDILQGFMSRINAFGWTSRMQFEETWATLLGVLVSQPIGDISQNATPVDETAIQLGCLTISSLTALVVSASMKPQAGQPWLGAFPHTPRSCLRPLPDNKVGHELNVVRRIIEKELDEILLSDALGQKYERYQLSSNCMIVKDLSLVLVDFLKSRLTPNPERNFSSPLHYGIGQKSVKSFLVQGISQKEEESVKDSSDEESVSSSAEIVSGRDAESSSQEFIILSGTSPLTPSNGDSLHQVDTNSCVQFLVDLFSEWFRSAITTPTLNQPSTNSPVSLRLPRQFLNDCLHSQILISDFFIDRQQFEWMFNSLDSLQAVQPGDDDIMLQYLVLGMCKSAAILGINRKSCEILYGMMEAAFASTMISCQTFALYGALYILESDLKDFMKPLINLISKFVHDKLKSDSVTILNSHQLLRSVISAGSYLLEKAQEFIPSVQVKEFIHSVLVMFSSSAAKSITNDLYILILTTLESFVSKRVVSVTDCEAIAKFANEQFVTSTAPMRTLASLNLVVTCLYFYMLRIPREEVSDEDALEFRLISMERISLMFDKMKSGSPNNSRTLVRILPNLMDSFFSTQDMMNKIIGEFASGLHPRPDLIAQVLFRIFQLLHARGESAVVSEWVLLTLRNFTQRTPIWSAIWRLTCLFVSASTNHWINSIMPMLLGELNMAPEDRNFDFFYISSKDFYFNQLVTDMDRRSFVSTFQSQAEPGNFYQNMLDTIET